MQNDRIVELGRKFKELKEEHEKQSDILKQVGVRWDEAERDLLEAMVEEGVKSIEIAGLGRFTMRVTNYLSVNAANKEGFYEYLKEAGHGGLLKLDVNPKTLTAFLSQHFEELQKKYGDEAGLDMVDAREKALEFLKSKGAAYFTKRDISLTKGK